MTINHHNFEAYLLDYLEGNLDPLLTADLMAFLAENPEYEAWVPDYDSRIMLQETLAFSGKSGLKKDFCDIPAINPENFEEFCIAGCEGMLSGDDRKRLEDYVAGDAARLKIMETYRILRLTADNSIVFPGKEKLKKSIPPVIRLRHLYYGIAVAASLTLMVMLGLQKSGDNTPTTLSGKAVNAEIHTPAAMLVPAPLGFGKSETARTVIRLSALAERTPDPVPPAIIQDTRETPVLASLNPLRNTLPVTLPYRQPLKPVLQNVPLTLPSAAFTDEPSGTEKEPSKTFLSTLVSRIDFWKTAENAVLGFNYLTEAQLSIDRQTDENGKITGLMLGIESRTITGNIIK